MLLAISCGDSEHTYREISIAYLKSHYRGYPYLVTENIAVEGVVTANNATHNLRNTILLEDNSGAIEIKSGAVESSIICPVGRRVRVRCQGLSLGGYGGVIELGAVSSDNDYQTSFLSIEQLRRHIDIVSDEPVKIDIPVVDIAELTPSYISRQVCIEGLRVLSVDDGWCSGIDSNQSHTAVDESGDTIELYIHGYADYALNPIPDYKIDVEGVVGYFNDYQIEPLKIMRHR